MGGFRSIRQVRICSLLRGEGLSAAELSKRYLERYGEPLLNPHRDLMVLRQRGLVEGVPEQFEGSDGTIRRWIRYVTTVRGRLMLDREHQGLAYTDS